eukprot:8301698-Pyramimonas_sp.AAC.1
MSPLAGRLRLSTFAAASHPPSLLQGPRGRNHVGFPAPSPRTGPHALAPLGARPWREGRWA